MEKGQLWVIIGVALVVAVVASIATASITGNAISARSWSSELKITGDGMLDPRLSFDNKQFGGAAIKFNEQGVYKAGISGGSFGLDSSVITLDANTVKTKSKVAIEGNGMIDPTLEFNNLQLGGAAIKFNEQGVYKAGISGGSFGFDSSLIILDSDSVKVNGLKGNGTAYACIDSEGKIFRSLVACK